MDEREGFLRAIREEPDDDVHRLVFADWLEDHGEADWAALIRHQCGLAGLLTARADPFVDAGAIDLSELHPDLRKSFLDWLAPFPELLPVRSGEYRPFALWTQCTFYARRGFLEHLRMIEGDALRALLDVLDQSRGAWARSLRCLSFGPFPHRYSSYAPFLYGRVPLALVGRFLRSRHLAHFSDIDLRACSFNSQRPVPLPRRWPAETRLWVHGRGVGLEADLERLQGRLGDRLVVDPSHPGDRVLDDDIPF